MPKELFNAGAGGNTGTVKTELAATDRIATGTPGYAGSDNITFANLQKQLSGRYKVEFENSDLVDGVLTVTHTKGTTNISIDYIRPDGTSQSIADLVTFTSVDYFTINFSGGIDVGTHTIYFQTHPDLTL